MGKRPATIRDANAPNDCADAGARRSWALRSVSVFTFLLLLVCAPVLRAQAGVITTAVGYALNDPSVSNASLIEPTSVAIDSTGNIYTADPYNCVVWKTLYGTSSVFAGILTSSSYVCTSGTATTVATTTPLAYPSAVAQCNGNVFVASLGIDPAVVSGSTEVAGTVDEVSTNGSLSALPLPSAQGGGGGPIHPVAIACDTGGDVYVSAYFYISDGSFASNVYQFSPVTGGGWTTGTPVNDLFDQAYTALAVSQANGDLYGIQAGQAGGGWLGPPTFGAGSIWDITQNASGLTSNNTFTNGSALAIDSNGNFYIAQSVLSQQPASYVDFVQPPNGTTTVVAGTGVLGFNGNGILSTQAEVDGVTGIVLDPTDGYIYLADSGNQLVRRIHSLTAGPTTLSLVSPSVPQTSGATYGSLQGALNPITGDFYYVTGTNTVNVINTGTNVISLGYERIIASIPVGAAGQAANGSALTLVVDSTRNLIYVSNTTDGNLYVINGSTHTVVGSVALDNPNASLLAIDIALNEVYAGGPNATKVSAVRGGTSPQLIGNAGYPVNSLSVAANTDVVYAVADSGAGGALQEALITMTPDPSTGVLTASITTFPLNEEVLQPAFIANSIAADPLSGSLIASGAASINPGSGQNYDVYDIFQFSPSFVTAPVPYTWPPITTSLDIPNRVFYVTDFDGLLTDPSSNATMVTGIDGVAPENNTLLTTTIPVFGSGTTPSSPHIFDAEPDTSSYQAWISGSDATDGGFVKLWDAGTQAVTESVTIPSNGGGHLFVNSSAQAAYLLDEVNGQLWLIDTPGWTPTPAPKFTQAQNGQSVTISATNSGDAVYYTLDGTPPGLSSNTCASPCSVGLSVGEFTTINAIEVDSGSGTPIASNDLQDVFTEPATTSLAIALSPNPTTGATLTATATITPASGVTSVTGTVNFAATPSGSFSPVTLCSQVTVENNAGSWQAVCNFTEDTAGSYTIAAAYSGDELNQASNNTAPLTVVQGTIPILGTVSGDTIALAINSNNTPGLTYNAVLNTDSSVSLLQDGAILSGQGCPAFTGSGSSLSVASGAVYVDFANSRIYLAMLNGVTLYAAYESIDQTTGICTQGPLLQLTANALSNLEMNVDPVQGNAYILNSFGAFPDTLYILPIAPWSVSSLPTPTTLTMDYSAQYGPIVIDPSSHQVYVNDLGGSAYGTVGTYSTSGFFVYDPNHSATPANNLQHVVGFNSGGTATTLNVGTLLDNGAGKLVLVNENPNASTVNLTVPITILDTTQFSFFANTTNPFTYNNDVDITPGAGLSTISATAQYQAIGGADIDTVNQAVYADAFNIPNSTQPGMLLEYKLSSTASPQETVLSSATAKPNLYGSLAPWSGLNYNPESTELVLSVASEYGSGALGLTSQLCAGMPLSLTQVFGSDVAPTPLGYPVVNATSGYVYAIQSGGIDFVAPPPSGCSAPPTYTVGGNVSGLASGTAVTLLDNGGDSVTVTYPTTSFTFPTALDSGVNYAVTVGTQPVGETCTVSAGSGVIGTSNVTNVAVACTANPTYTVAGNVSGLTSGTSVSLLDNGGDSVTVTYPTTSFTFPTALDSGVNYAVTVGTQPVGETCTVSAGSGVIGTSNVTNVAVACTANPTYTVAGNVSGLTSGTSVSLLDNGGDSVTVTYPTTSFTFPTALDSGASYAVTVGTQPTGETCAVTNGSGTVTSSNITNVSVTCSSSVSAPAQVTDNETITVSDSETFPDVIDSEKIAVTDTDTVRAYNPITITPNPATFNASSGNGYATYAYTAPFTATGGIGTLTLTESGALPAGLTFTGAALSGTPAASSVGNTYTFSVTATDADGDSVTVPGYSLTILAASAYPAVVTDNETITVSDTETFPDVVDSEPIMVTDTVSVTTSPIITSPSTLPAGVVGVPYVGATFTASGGSLPYAWGATGLPSGLTLSSGGVISGTPTTSTGSPYSVAVTVTDSTGKTASATFSLAVTTASAPLTITGPASLPAGIVGVAYPATTIAASGGSPPYSWSATGLPAGLSISSTGVLSGTPASNTAGTSSVVVTVTDSNSNTANKNYSLTVIPPPSLMVSASPVTLTIIQGQTGQTTITLTPQGGYSGTLTLTCTGLPANALCQFKPTNSVVFTGVNDQPVSVVLTIETDVNPQQARMEPAPTPLRRGAILAAVAFWCPGSLLGLLALRRKRKLFSKNPRTFGLCLFALLLGTLAGLAGCISGGGFGSYVTPVGNSTVTIAVTPNSGDAQTLNIGVTITH